MLLLLDIFDTTLSTIPALRFPATDELGRVENGDLHRAGCSGKIENFVASDLPPIYVSVARQGQGAHRVLNGCESLNRRYGHSGDFHLWGPYHRDGAPEVNEAGTRPVQ